ncbi:olfactory receptor 1D2-like [Brienomyrus brachyistius]|uniref:olfactory receptor 1D2-like n=1 Tax=Brienomyrus brachyistius TaxID=42636 RepID=UPI0020B27627|nr:olfactory receptor 1D2-like [Brienomyrus brachyistius]
MNTAKMENSSSEIVFVLSGLNETKTTKQIYFAFALLAYIFTLFANVTLVLAVFFERILHEPMYIFLCNLCVNGIFGATGFYPKILIDLLSDSHVISYRACLTQIYMIYNYVFCEFVNLAVMAYDRYVAICKPLEYHSIMTPWKVGKLLLVIWLIPFCETSIGMIMTARLTLCGSRIDKLYCTNWEVVKLSCRDTTLNNLYGYILMFMHVFQAFLLILISYIHIIRTCLRSRVERSKFMETCLPHLITLMNFTLSFIFDVMYARYGSQGSLQSLRNILTVEYLVVPPLLNPLIYGLKLKQIRRSIWRRFQPKNCHAKIKPKISKNILAH